MLSKNLRPLTSPNYATKQTVSVGTGALWHIMGESVASNVKYVPFKYLYSLIYGTVLLNIWV